MIATPRIGVLGPAVSLFAIYAVSSILFVRITNQMLGLGSAGWAGQSVLRPAIAAAGVAVLAWLATPGGLGLAVGAAWLVIVTLASMAAALAVSPGARGALTGLGKRLQP